MNQTIVQQAIGQYPTPFYLFDTDIACQQVLQFKQELGPNVGICYAMKANSFLVQRLESVADYFEVCSPGELRICQRVGIPPEKLVLSGIYKDSADLHAALERYGSRITYTVESLHQWELLSDYASAQQCHLQVLVRLTSGNQFGINAEDIRALIGQNNPFVKIEGIQYFSGTQKHSPSRLQEELERLDTLLCQLEQEFHYPLSKLEYGPGFPVTYFENETDAYRPMMDALSQGIRKLRFTGHVVLELGRSIAAACGSYVTKVVDTKCNRNDHYCIVDGGIHQINYFGQMLAIKRPPVRHWCRQPNGEKLNWTVCGSLCTMNDVLLKAYPFEGLQIGDYLIFSRVGAYSATEGISLFLSRDLPQVLLYDHQSGLRQVRDTVRTDVLNSEDTKQLESVV